MSDKEPAYLAGYKDGYQMGRSETEHICQTREKHVLMFELNDLLEEQKDLSHLSMILATISLFLSMLALLGLSVV